ncbi:MAG TPA: hypothetical protein VJO99_04315 [Burkholderiaceae bacterium]|nr:hypothetical protein [Burkholderiaceae bacterium]
MSTPLTSRMLRRNRLFLIALALIGLIVVGIAAPAFAQTNVGVSVSVAKPGVYGRIDIGGLPPPPVILPQPMIIAPQPVAVVQPAPVYLYVPPGHQKKWAKHCAQYNACGQPVYFVKESWVQERYVHEHGGRHDDDDNDQGHGHGHGKGHGKGKH